MLSSADLLDLYVQHMDETMRSAHYRKTSSKLKLPRKTRSLIDSPLLTAGSFRKQHLDVDENWMFNYRRKKKPIFEDEGLEIPNPRIENTEPGLHELLKMKSKPKVTLKKEHLANNRSRTVFKSHLINEGFKWNRVPKKYARIEKNRKTRKGSFFGKKSKRQKRKAHEVTFNRYEILDDAGDFVLEWDSTNEKIVTFRVTARTLGYVAIGFNKKTHMKGADLIITWVDDHTGIVNLLVRSFLYIF